MNQELNSEILAAATAFLNALPIIRDTPSLTEDERVGYFIAAAQIHPEASAVLTRQPLREARTYIRQALKDYRSVTFIKTLPIIQG